MSETGKKSSRELLEILLNRGFQVEPKVKGPDNKEMIIMALTELGGAAHVNTICEHYRRIRTAKRTDMRWKSEEQIADIVRSTLRRNAVGNQSSDVYEGARCFVKCETGLGYWRLVSGVRYDDRKKRVVWGEVRLAGVSDARI